MTPIDDLIIAAEVLPDLIENRILSPRNPKIAPA
jgi:hypothetical protein